MKKTVIIIFAILLTYCYLFAQSLYEGVTLYNPNMYKKTILAKNIGVEKSLYESGNPKDSCYIFLAWITGAEFYSSLVFCYNNENYYIPIMRTANDQITAWNPEYGYYIKENDSIVIDIIIFPFLDKDRKEPLAIITNVKKLDSVKITDVDTSSPSKGTE